MDPAGIGVLCAVLAAGWAAFRAVRAQGAGGGRRLAAALACTIALLLVLIPSALWIGRALSGRPGLATVLIVGLSAAGVAVLVRILRNPRG